MQVFTSAPYNSSSSLLLYLSLQSWGLLSQSVHLCCSHSWLSHLILLWVPYWAPDLCHTYCLYHVSQPDPWFTIWFIISHLIRWCMGSHLKSRPRHQKSWLDTGRFILHFVVDSSAKYKKIRKGEKDPKGPYAFNTCSTKLLSRQTKSLHVLKSHWPLQKIISY